MLPLQNATPTTPLGSPHPLQVEGVLDASRPTTRLQLADGTTLALDTETLLRAIEPSTGQPLASDSRQNNGETTDRVIPMLAEELHVGKRTVTTGTVQLHRGTETFTDSASVELMRVGWEVERVTIGHTVAERPEIREEGDVTVFPLVEERIVARKEYFLLEEVRVRRVATTQARSVTMELKRDTLTVEQKTSPQE